MFWRKKRTRTGNPDILDVFILVGILYALSKISYNKNKNANLTDALKLMNEKQLKAIEKHFVKSESFELAAQVRDEIMNRELKKVENGLD